MYYLIKVYDEDSQSTTTISGHGDIEVIKKDLEADGWIYVSHREVEVE